MVLDKSRTVSFSGYRPHKFDFPLTGDIYDKFVHKNLDVVIKMADTGYLNFVIGCAPGFDIICGELIKIARNVTQNSIKIICALPYNDFIISEYFNDEWRSRLKSLIADSDYVINVTGKDYKTTGCFQRRNEFMIDNSSKLICYHTGKSGGTANTIKYALENGLEIINLADMINQP